MILIVLHGTKTWKLMWLMGSSTRLTAVYLVDYIQVLLMSVVLRLVVKQLRLKLVEIGLSTVKN